MQYKQLGNTDIKVSVICLGTMTFGEQNTEQEAHQQLDYALANDVNFIDTAELYAVPIKAETYGLTETYIGTWLEKRNDRDKMILASKVSGPGPEYIRGGPRYTREQMTEALNNSLQRLKTDYLDLYQLHWPQRQTNFFGQLDYSYGDDAHNDVIETSLEVLNDFVKEGKVRHIGVSNETPWGVSEYLRLAEAKTLPKIVSIQNPYSLLNRTFESGLAEFAHRSGTPLLAYSPLGFGMLTGKYRGGAVPAKSRLDIYGDYFTRYSNKNGIAATERYLELADKHNLSATHLALAFINQQPFTASNIIGATTMEQLKENIASGGIVLSEDIIKDVNAVHADIPNPCP